MPHNIVCLISGRGSNLDALLRTARVDDWERVLDAHCAAVISDRRAAAGLTIAASYGVATEAIAHEQFAEPGAFDAALLDRLRGYAPDLVVLAGFMRILGAAVVDRYRGRLINIHPSLLPAFPGLATHRRALAAGVRLHGATVHFVEPAVDTGPIIAQAAVPVLADDTEETLAARVLAREHLLLPRCVRWILEGRVRLASGQVVLRDLDRAATMLWPA